MSSILKALKKVENQNRPGQEGSAWMRRVPLRRSFKETAGDFWLLYRPVLICGFLVCLVGMVLTVVLTRIWQIPAAPNESASNGAPENANVSLNPVAARTPLETAEINTVRRGASPGSSSRPAGSTGKSFHKNAPATPPLSAPLQSGALRNQQLPTILPPTSVTASRPLAAASSVPDSGKTAYEGAAVPPEKRHATGVIRLVSGSGLSLQAISWAENAERSIAVVNDRVVHENEVVSGYTIHRISPDDVLLQKDGEMYQLVFPKK